MRKMDITEAGLERYVQQGGYKNIRIRQRGRWTEIWYNFGIIYKIKTEELNEKEEVRELFCDLVCDLRLVEERERKKGE